MLLAGHIVQFHVISESITLNSSDSYSELGFQEKYHPHNTSLQNNFFFCHEY
jgi:hypothetical protein